MTFFRSQVLTLEEIALVGRAFVELGVKNPPLLEVSP